ncbi:MAG: GNAT family N-acetyltransferase [Methanobacteriaceae archaeon]|nr:GNAT family N-acetyltransferase [Methanobacteriaceae archaeon]
MDYNIRNVKEKDFTDIAKLARECKPMSTERNSIYHIFTKFFQETSLILEKQEDGSICGFLLGLISQNNPNEAYIHLFCLKKELRGQGLAKRIIDKYKKIVKSRGCKKISLITKPINKKAIKFYTTLGFQLVTENDEKMVIINNVSAVKDYNGAGEHMVLFEYYLYD